jgi:hypothetical protein
VFGTGPGIDGHRLVFNGSYSQDPNLNWFAVGRQGYVTHVVYYCPSDMWSNTSFNNGMTGREVLDWHWSVSHAGYKYLAGPNRWLFANCPRQYQFRTLWRRQFRDTEDPRIPLFTDKSCDETNPHEQIYGNAHNPDPAHPMGGNVALLGGSVSFKRYEDMDKYGYHRW